MRKIKCEICGIKTCRSNNEKRIFMAKFPMDKERCRQWVAATGNEDLIYVPIEKLHQLKYICGKHFKPRAFKKKKTQLRKTAVPSIDISQNPLTEEMMREFPLYIAPDESIHYSLRNHNYCMKDSFSSNIQGIPLHNFPNPRRMPKQFEQWVELVGEPVENLTPDEIFGRKKVCDLHFTIEDKNRNSRLSAIAIPVPFPYQKYVNRRKRASPASASSVQHLEPEHESANECETIQEEPADNSTVPFPKKYSWQKQSEVINEDCLDASEDNLSMYGSEQNPEPRHDTTLEDNVEEHKGFKCNVCGGAIIGFRYTCVQCSDFDLCSACEANKAHHHHYVLRVPAPRPFAEVESILASIRRHLMKTLDPTTAHNEDADDAASMKSEVKSEVEDDDDEKKLPDVCDTSTSDSNEDEQYVDADGIEDKEPTRFHEPESDPLAICEQNDEESGCLMETTVNTQASECQSQRPARSPAPGTTAKTRLVIRRAKLLNAAEVIAAKKLCIRPNLVSQSSDNPPLARSQSAGVIGFNSKVRLLLKLPHGAIIQPISKGPPVTR